MLKLDQLVVVFDLDDTLYKEVDYQASGFRAIAEKLQFLQIAKKTELEKFFMEFGKEANFLDKLCHFFDFSEPIKQSLLWVYRLHEPSISLNLSAQSALSWAKINCKAVSIVTDGRSLSQRSKLSALGLSNLKTFVSEECGYEKPNPYMFLRVQSEWPDSKYVYVGDNVSKDFLIPNQLGWMSIGLRDNGRNIERQHSAVALAIDSDYQPKVWLEDLAQLPDTVGMENC